MKVFVYGARGHGKVVADILLAGGHHDLSGFVDDDESLSDSMVMGVQIIGPDRLRSEATNGNVGVALGVGDNGMRQKLAGLCKLLGVEIVTLIHPSATVAKSAHLQQGTVVMAGAVINPCAEVGFGVIVNSGAVIEHDVLIGDYAHVSPNAVMGGESRLGTLSHLGLGAVILPRVTVGNRTVIGAGAVVTREMPDDIIAIGVPARVRRRTDHD
jgi:sugar O-acyltransferase (sialic acid O-acetyltransferase NeuD family)